MARHTKVIVVQRLYDAFKIGFANCGRGVVRIQRPKDILNSLFRVITGMVGHLELLIPMVALSPCSRFRLLKDFGSCRKKRLETTKNNYLLQLGRRRIWT
ncbi:hypothetical protein L1987_79624 [Smallanthus sonchifolius]|uniref:Uncharacterized protein n=1 Tax=Smallanthus sonchifolius TaxID=185202 RepID=A0ACB8YKF1_9ASTR|nr:hypothetical protein L1987_79624 [Smallanthus sonchifolius]